MGLIEKVAQIDKKFGWSFLGFVLAAIFGGIAIYTEFVKDTSAVVRYEILSNTKILDVKEDISGLSIIYNTEDIRKARKTLSVVIVNIGNEGQSPILKSHYDNESPLGLSTNSGEIIKAEVIAATTEYIKKNVGIHIHDPYNVEFSQIIIEPNESFTVKLLVLNPEQSILNVSPKGKIAGVKKLLLVDSQSEQTKETFISKVVSGSLWVQVVRTLTYVTIFILLLIIVIMPLAYISEKKGQWKRNRIIKQFKSRTNPQLNDLNIELYDFYKYNELRLLKEIKKILADDTIFQSLVKEATAHPSATETIVDSEIRNIATDIPLSSRSVFPPTFILRSMMELGLISKIGKKYTRNEERIKATNEFISFAVQQQRRK